MADNIELIKTPPTIALLDEGLRFQVETKTDFSGSAALLKIRMSQTQSEYLDHYFTLEFLGIELQFLFKTTPDQSGEQLTTWDVAESYQEFCERVTEEMNLNYYLNEHYTVTLSFTHPYWFITITAKEDGSLYDIALKETDITSLLFDTETAGVNSSIPDDYKIYFAPFIYAADPETLDPLGEEKVNIDSDQIAEVNLAAYLDDELKTQFTFPFNGVNQRTVADAIKKYFINYAEYQDDKTQLLRTNYASPLYVVRGGLQRIDSDFFYEADGNYFDYGTNIQRFLNWAPSDKRTYPDVPERLYFLKSTEGTLTVKLKVKIVDTAEAISNLTTITADQYSIIELAVGLPELYPGEDISDVEWYEIWIENAGEAAVSETRRFTVDHTEYLNLRVLWFKNSFDVYETICCTGDLKTVDKFKRQEVEVKEGPVFRRKTKSVEQTQPYTLSSGWLPGIEYRNWLTEVMLSTDAFYMLGDFLLPVLMKNKKVNRHKDREYMYSISFQFEPDFKESRYSAIVGEGAYFLLDEDGIILLDEDGIGLIGT